MSNQNNKPAEKNGNKEVQERKPSHSERFQKAVTKEFSSLVGKSIDLDEHQKRLVQNLFVKVDIALNDFEADRIKKNQTNRSPITWANVNMSKLAVDAVHTVRLGLDALVPNHVHPIPYWSTKNSSYDLDLRVGYKGQDYYRRQVAVKQPKDIRYELVYSTDHFKALKKTDGREIESYEFEVNEPFNRGDVVGGFGYIIFDDPSENKLVVVSEDEFVKVKQVAKASNFWNDWGDKMRFKTLVHRVTDELQIDPKKANSSFHYVEKQENIFDDSDLDDTPQLPEKQHLDIDIPDADYQEEPADREHPEQQEFTGVDMSDFPKQGN
jgi:recombination protein RecT